MKKVISNWQLVIGIFFAFLITIYQLPVANSQISPSRADFFKNFPSPAQYTGANIPEFIYKLLQPPIVQRQAGPGITHQEVRIVENRQIGACQLVKFPHCDLDGAANDNGTFRLNWICLDFVGGCKITKNGQPFMDVDGEGFLDQLPAGTNDKVTLKLASADASCKDEWAFTPPPGSVPPPPPPSCPVVNNATVTEKDLKFYNNALVSGTFPRYRLVANDNGTVKVNASVSGPFLGGPCLNPLLKLYLYDNNALVGSPVTADIPWSGNLGSINVTSGTTHSLEMKIVTNCSAGPVESSGYIPTVSMTLAGPLGPSCPIIKTITVPSVTYTNNQLTGGSLPQYTFTAGNNEVVTVRESVGAYTGGPCLNKPPFRVSLYDNGTPRLAETSDSFDGTDGGWSRTFQPFQAIASHLLQMQIVPNCTSGNFQSTETFPNVTMTIRRDYP